jgi:hypothetical protein
LGGVDCGLHLHGFGRYVSGHILTDVTHASPLPLDVERVFRLPRARVACANYHALVFDFPQIFGDAALKNNPLPGCDRCARAGRLCRKMLNAWILNNAGFISEQQLLPNSVNGPINVDLQTYRTAYRPPQYGRAAIVSIDVPANKSGNDEGGKYLDLKGVGVAPGREPTRLHHSNGLEYLGNALADFFYGWVVDSIFAKNCPGYQVLPVYAVLDLGFDIFSNEHGPAPAGMHVRRAHARPYPQLPLSGSAHEKMTIHIELLLRHFGLTSATYGTALTLSGHGEEAGLSTLGRRLALKTEADKQKARHVIDLIREGGFTELSMSNIQLTNEMDWDAKSVQIFDFGHFSAARKFESPFANKIRDAALGVGRIIKPDDPLYVQPDRKVRIDPELCERESVNSYTFYAAEKFRHMPKQFTQKRLERMMRIARVKAFGRRLDRG